MHPYLELIEEAADAARLEMQRAALAGIFLPMRLFFLEASNDGPGRLRLVREDCEPPAGYRLATTEHLGINIPYAHYFEWIRRRSGSLPIL